VTTVAIQLWGGQRRSQRNLCATALALPALDIAKRATLQTMFASAYARFAEPCRAVDEPGLAIVAVDEDTGLPAGLVRLRARVQRHVVALIGRHTRCDLLLDSRASLALRHLAVVLDPVTSFTGGAAYRVLDLRTRSGFTDETGRELRGLRADGPAVLRCAGHVLFMLPLGDPTDWPADGNDAWAMLPERVYFDEQGAPEEQRSMLRGSMLMRMKGPRDTGMQLAETGACGTLELIGVKHRATITVGPAALRDGLLVGRYTRCDSSQLIDDISLSRVHMLLLEVGDALLAIDTASSNGVRLLGCPDERVLAVPDRADLGLGTSTRMRWRRLR
jgi:hypothetical protein